MTKEKFRYTLVCLIALTLYPVCACANVVWPSLYILEGMMSWYVILLGLIAEILFVKYFLGTGWLKSVLIAFVMNLVSAVLGFVAIPVSGLLVEILLLPFSMATFDISHWILSYIFAILLNVVIEGLTVKLIFKYKFKKMFLWLFLANSISIIICILFHGIMMDNIVM